MSAPDWISALAEDVENCVSAIRATHADWPCRKGCDGCCRRLAELPRLTESEWQWMRAGLELLTADERAAIEQRVREAGEARGLVCPLLDEEEGVCRVYRHRPIACRTYGFYVERDKGLYCGIIASRVEAGEMAGVVWGNHEAVDWRLSRCGGTRSLAEWMASSDWR